jgi:hypothetical protein
MVADSVAWFLKLAEPGHHCCCQIQRGVIMGDVMLYSSMPSLMSGDHGAMYRILDFSAIADCPGK